MVDPFADKQFHNADQELVAYDGSPVVWRVSAYAIVEQDGKILIIKNRKEKFFDIIGGGIEFGENIQQTLTREAMEEGGATIEVGELLSAHVDWFYGANKCFYQTLQLFYKAELVGELGKPTEEDIGWREFVLKEEIGQKYRLPKTVEQVLRESRIE